MSTISEATIFDKSLSSKKNKKKDQLKMMEITEVNSCEKRRYSLVPHSHEDKIESPVKKKHHSLPAKEYSINLLDNSELENTEKEKLEIKKKQKVEESDDDHDGSEIEELGNLRFSQDNISSQNDDKEDSKDEKIVNKSLDSDIIENHADSSNSSSLNLMSFFKEENFSDSDVDNNKTVDKTSKLFTNNLEKNISKKERNEEEEIQQQSSIDNDAEEIKDDSYERVMKRCNEILEAAKSSNKNKVIVSFLFSS